MSGLRVYLAGPITGTTYDGCTGWREHAAAVLAPHGLVGLSPMRGKDYLAAESTIADQYDETVLSSQRGIMTRDRWDAHRTDILLVNLLGAERVSIGTVMEIAWADSVRAPIVLAMESGGLHDHAMVREAAGFIVPTLDEALDIVVALGRHG